ncbi:MAG TPA: hypothetical protein VF015_09910 [Acidimicrobiales bacterium]
MALTLVSVIAVVALAAALVLFRSRSDLRRRLAAVRADAGQLADRLGATVAERDELHDKVEGLTATNARVAEDADRQRQRADELAVLVEAAGAGGTGAAGDADAAEPDDAGLWHLLLAHVTRRWAAVVGVPPANRDMVEGAAADQLAQALGREVERLREEVGVDVELTVAGPVEPQDRVPFLLAAIELLGALASSAERVSVDLDGRLVLVGEGWADLAGELDAARARAVAAGAQVTAVEAEPDRVRLEVTA